MAEWNADLPWWALVDRKEAILAGRDVAIAGGVVVLSGPAGYGHVQGLSFVCRVLTRTGWLCHDLSSVGPMSVSTLMIEALESVFPTQPGGLTHRGQIGDLGLRLLQDHFKQVFTRDEQRHCLVVPYLDEQDDLQPSHAAALEAVSSDRLLIAAGVVRPTSAGKFKDATVVELTGFSARHVELCLRRAERASDQQIESIRPTLEALQADDGTVVPSAAYAWLQAAWRDLA